jgi:hypothetical protein
MRIYHFTIIFAIFAAMMLYLTEMTMKQNMEEDREIQFFDRVMDRASTSAAQVLALAGTSGIEGVKDLAADTFYEALAAGLGQSGETPSMTKLRLYVPVIAVTDGESVFICYDRFEKEENRNVLVRAWSEPVAAGADELSELLEYYCNNHNQVAERAGIQYSFVLPESDGGLFARGSGGPGFYALFQGYRPSGFSSVSNCFSFSGTGVMKAEQFFINVSGNGYSSERYYHRKGCMHLSEESIMFTTGKDCALHGAFECPNCMGGY